MVVAVTSIVSHRKWIVRLSSILGLLLLGAAIGCTAPRAGGNGDTPTAGAAREVPSDSATVARLEREARALARADGCSAGGDCRAAPLGARPCGGPRDYLVYCARTTDSSALYRKLEELRQAETAYNQRTGAMSTCEFREPPRVGAVGNSCRVVP